MCEGSLGIVEASCDSYGDAGAVDGGVGHNHVLRENGVVQSEGSRVEVEVSGWRRWIVGGLSFRPSNLLERWCRNTVFSFTKIVLSWRFGVDGTTCWLRNVTDISWRATPESACTSILRDDWPCICWWSAHKRFSNRDGASWCCESCGDGARWSWNSCYNRSAVKSEGRGLWWKNCGECCGDLKMSVSKYHLGR